MLFHRRWIPKSLSPLISIPTFPQIQIALETLMCAKRPLIIIGKGIYKN